MGSWLLMGAVAAIAPACPAQFALFNVPLPSVAAINGIFGKLLEGRFTPDVFSDDVSSSAALLSKTSCQFSCLQSFLL